ncbi:E3 ubiquitin-protein ligase ATL6-like [Rosa sericea]
MRINHGALILVLLLSVLPFRTINNAQPTTRSGSSSSSSPPPENNKSHAISNDANKRYKIVSLILGSLVLISFCVVGIILPCFYESICSCVNKLCPRRNGLDQAVIETFPVLNYSTVKGLKEESAPELECAVCLNEFSDDETLRVLPCNHVFHPWCIDAWLADNKTCPVCRAKNSRHGRESKPDVRVGEPITDGFEPAGGA